jgi:hypothetical protein
MKLQLPLLAAFGLVANVLSAPAADPRGTNGVGCFFDYQRRKILTKVEIADKRDSDTLYQPLDYVYDGKKLDTKEKRDGDDLYIPLDYVYGEKKLDTKK